MADPSDGLRRVCLVAGTATYGPDFDDLEDVRRETALVQGVLTTTSGMALAPGSEIDPEAEAFLRAVGRAADGSDASDTSEDDVSEADRSEAGGDPPDALVVYYSGHGFLTETDYCLATGRSALRSDRHSITARELAREVTRAGPREVAVVIDACHAAAAESEFQRVCDLVLSQDRSRAPVYLIMAASAVETAEPLAFAEAFAAALQWPRLPHTTRYVHPELLSKDINDRLGAPDQRAWFSMSKHAPRDGCRIFPNPRYVEGILPIDLASQGLVKDAPGIGWAFVGRRREIGELVAHLCGTDSADRPLLLTGGRGSGKSTLLAWLAAASRGSPLKTADSEAVLSVPPGCVDVIVDALAEGPLGVAQSIVLRLLHRIPSDIQGCLKEIEAYGQPLRILIDAVDGSSDPHGMAALVRALSGIPGVRLVASALSPVKDVDWDVLSLDDPDHFRADDVRLLALTVLSRHEQSCHHDTPRPVLDRAAQRVADYAGTSYMRALFYACHLATQEMTEMRAFADEIFASQLAGLHSDDPEWAADLLTPLAFALGGGLPGYSVWIGLVREVSGRTVTFEELDRILRLAGHLITESAGSEGIGGWRLQHEDLADYLRHRADARSVHLAFTRALRSALTGPGEDGARWSEADPYTRLNFAEHAVLAHTLEEYLDDPEFLLAADPARLLRALALADSEAARTVRTVYNGVRGPGSTDGCELSRLSFLAGAYGRPALAARARDRSQGWTPSWDEPRRSAEAAVVVRSDSGGHLVVTAPDGTVRTSDGRSDIWRTLVPSGESVTALGGGCLSGRPLLAVGGWTGALTLHDLEEGTRSSLGPFDGTVVSCPITEHGLLVASDAEWQLFEPARIWPRVDAGGLVLQSAAIATLDGHPVVVGASADRVVVWLGRTGERLHSFTPQSRKAVRLVAAHGRTVLTAGHDGAVYATDPTGDNRRLLVRHGHRPVTSLRITGGPAAPALVSAALDGTVRITPLTRHGTRRVVDVGMEVHCADVDLEGRLVICTTEGVARISRWGTERSSQG